MNKCIICNQEFNNARGLANHYQAKHKLTGNEYYKLCNPDREESVDYVVCPICGAERHNLTKHLKCHNMTKDEFLKQYPGYQMVCNNTIKLMSDAAKVEYEYRKDEMTQYGSIAITAYNKSPSKWTEELRNKSSIRLTNTLNRLWNEQWYINQMKEERSHRFDNEDYYKNFQNKVNGGFKEYESGVFFRSYLEYRLFRLLRLDNLDFEYEPFTIRYYDSEHNKIRRYHPDFYIPKYNLLIEVKSYSELHSTNVIDKMLGVLDCNSYNYIFIHEGTLYKGECSSTIERIITGEIL